jgi:hypothetical protein
MKCANIAAGATDCKLSPYAPSSEQDSSDSATRVCGSTWSTWLNHDTSSSLLTSTWGLKGKYKTKAAHKAEAAAAVGVQKVSG